MPSASTISGSDKAKVKAAVAATKTKIITATVARLYASEPESGSWKYSGLEGAIAFVRDNEKNTFYLKLVDLKVSFERTRRYGCPC